MKKYQVSIFIDKNQKVYKIDINRSNIIYFKS